MDKFSPQSSDEALASVVKESIERTGLPLREVADQSGVAVTTLKRRLAGNSSFTLSELVRIGEVCGLTPSQFLQRTEQALVAGAA